MTDPTRPAAAQAFVASGPVDRSPAGLAELERRALAAAPVAAAGVDDVLRRFRARLADIDTRLDAAATLAELREHSDPPLSPRAGLLRALAGFVLLIGPVVALALLVVRRALPLDAALGASAVIMAVAAVIGLVMAVIGTRAVRLVRFRSNYLVGTAVVAALVGVAAVGLPAWNPGQAGPDAGPSIAVTAIGALVVIGASLAILLMARGHERRVAAATDGIRPRVDRVIDELDRARTDALAELAGFEPDAAADAARADRDAAVRSLVKRYLLPAPDAAALTAMPLGAFQLMPDYLALVDGAGG